MVEDGAITTSPPSYFRVVQEGREHRISILELQLLRKVSKYRQLHLCGGRYLD